MQPVEQEPDNNEAMLTDGTRVKRIRDIQSGRGENACFLTSKRLTCKDADCEWRKDCRKLVAIWKR